MPFALLPADAAFEVGELQTSKKGQKFCDIRIAGECPSFQLSPLPLYSPFGVGVYQGTGEESRMNWDLHIDEQTKQRLLVWDAFFARELKKHAKNAQYHPIVQCDGEHPDKVRMKINCAGPHAARIWSDKQEPLGDVRKLATAGAYCIPIIKVQKAWYMGGLYVVSLECSAAVLSAMPPADADMFPL